MSRADPISARAPVWVGSVSAAILMIGFGVWAAAVPIDGAVLATGEVDTSSNRRFIQHSEGGMVAEVAVREGQEVVAGQVLIRLQDPNVEMQWDLVTGQLEEARARSLRLTAERDDTDWPSMPEVPLAQGSEVMAAQRRLFDARREAQGRQLEQLSDRQAQTEAQILGLGAQDEAMVLEAALLAAELAQQRDLQDRGLTQMSRVTALEREAVRLEGRRAALSARASELRGLVADIGHQIEALRASRRDEAIGLLAETGAQLVELTARRAALAERRALLQIRTPVAGVIYGMVPMADGMVLRPGEPLMQVLERSQTPRLTFRVRPQDIDDVHVGQVATVQFPGMDATLSGLDAVVTAISAATFSDDRTGVPFFRVDMELTPDALRTIQDLPVLPGLSAQAFLSTGARTPLAYFLSPIAEQFNRAMRDP
tara:strand:+ start:1489 stop:2769 length:1281 start_codon:yes stop_codon:yes gene_type:complete